MTALLRGLRACRFQWFVTLSPWGRRERIFSETHKCIAQPFMLDAESEASFTEGCEPTKFVPGDRVRPYSVQPKRLHREERVARDEKKERARKKII
jgi:hypothetical protein